MSNAKIAGSNKDDKACVWHPNGEFTHTMVLSCKGCVRYYFVKPVSSRQLGMLSICLQYIHDIEGGRYATLVVCVHVCY